MSLAMAFVDMFPEQMKPYLKIIRMHDPTLNVMVFWPTAWCIELSNTSNLPNVYLLTLFFLESFILHGAGLILNDIFDRSIDRQVKRTQGRPLLTGELSLTKAKCYLAILLSIGISLLLQFNYICLWLLTMCAVSSTIYPVSKRFMHFPEIVLGRYTCMICSTFRGIHIPAIF
ncbi:4-hydroxybenzoate octaprenyltransferase-like isoform X1 [Ruditapes philippinarum]|uniref:4-hydroxybenzoate octaprenyltransferase-like isoform X1 n=1 Tax=Ruditapes philippinarum TaxID=129788 RepID=UPI00295AE26D|nr:4-hydroxybenzoate octaprenyltransferase-like isoform X1 [Ruditapes philippinarum]